MIPRTFDFDGSQRYLDVKKINDALYKSRLHGWNYSISPGNNLPAFIPDRCIPIKHEVKADPIKTYEKKSPVVIQKGTIVAVESVGHYASYSGNSENTERGVTPSGMVRLGTDIFGNPIMANVNDEAYGYGTTLNGGFVTIANGGAKAKDLYTQLDVDHEVYKQDGSLAAVDEEYVRSANIPAGIAINNMFIDDKGKVYNFNTQYLELNSIETDYYVTFPYVNSDAYNKFSLSVDGAGAQTMGDAYAAVVNDFPFFYGNKANFISGKLVKSDANGKFVLQDADTTVDDAVTCQTVGKALLWDNIYPKEKMDEIITYGQVTGDPTWDGLGVTGSDTNGIPITLVLFAWKILQAQNGSAPSLGDIQDAIKAGNFGYVKINLHVS